MEDEDIIMPDEEVEIPSTPEEGEKAEETTEANTKEEVPEEQEKKFLEYLNSKDIKYNGEKVTVNSLDDLINTYQKGMNYDKLKARNDADGDYVRSYINEKAKIANLSPKEYIDKVKAYEKEKEQEQLERDINTMVSKGIDEQLAREVAETKAARKEWEKERIELQKMREQEEQKRKENEEYEKFIEAHPEVKPNDIPPEVFQEAKEIGLNAAYLKYENKILNERIKQMEQNEKNVSSSPVRTNFKRKLSRTRE